MSRESLITKYVDGFPFTHLFVSRDGRRVYYLWRKEGRGLLHRAQVSEGRLDRGEKLSDFDFTAGSFWIFDEDAERGHLYVIRDEDNRENYNVWRIDLRTGALSPVTRGRRVMGLSFSPDFSKAWGKDRQRLPDGTFHSRIFEIELGTGETRTLVDDAGADYRIGWGQVHKSADSEHLVYAVDYFSRRQRTNIQLHDLKTGTGRRLLPEWMEEAGNPDLFDDHVAEGRCLYLSVHEGVSNLYDLDWATGTSRRVTDFTTRTEALSVQNRREGTIFTAAVPLDEGFEIRVYRRDGAYTATVVDGAGSPFRTDEDLWFVAGTLDRARALVRLEDKTFEPLARIELTGVPAAELEHSVSKAVSYPTFDGHRVSAWLQRPKGELKGAVVVAFYGGQNEYNRYQQMFAELGLAVLSPAVRGSWGWARDWEKKLEGDLGGDEIIDLAWGARWLEKELKLPASRIGVWGSSHGGYATLRAATMPADFRGPEAKARYDFGFAISEAGFADLEIFHRDSSIADWLVHLLGPFEAAKYRERSPAHFVDNLKCPLLIVNGTHDARVPFSTMQGFIEKVRQLDKPHRVLLHEGQGHHAGTREALLQDFRALVEFLDDFVLNQKA